MIYRDILNATVGMDSAWIGLRRDDQTFVWLDGVTANQKTVGWADNEPSNYGGRENCTHVNHPNHPFNTINDIPCNVQYHGLCEKFLFA